MDVSTLRGKAKKMALAAQGPIIKSTPYFDKEVYKALYDLTRVRISFYITYLPANYLTYRLWTLMAVGKPCVRRRMTRRLSSTRRLMSSRSSTSMSTIRVISILSGPPRHSPRRLPLNRALLLLLSRLWTRTSPCPLSRPLLPSLLLVLSFLLHPLALPCIKALARLGTSVIQTHLAWKWTPRTPKRPARICTLSCGSSTPRVSCPFLSHINSHYLFFCQLILPRLTIRLLPSLKINVRDFFILYLLCLPVYSSDACHSIEEESLPPDDTTS